ncbi:hypothetical protein ACHQM5_022327 [Ranunculus cassubicifolius]
MFNFEDEIVMGFSDRVPWLLLVNLLVMFLLIVVLCYSTIFSLDIITPNDQDQDLKSKDCTTMMVMNNCRGFSYDHQDSKATQDHNIVNDSERTSTSRRRNLQREVIEEIQDEGKYSGREDLTAETMSYSSYSPCHWLELASKVFLSCFGLLECQDSTRNKRRVNNNDDYSSSSTGSRPHQL